MKKSYVERRLEQNRVHRAALQLHMATLSGTGPTMLSVACDVVCGRMPKPFLQKSEAGPMVATPLEQLPGVAPLLAELTNHARRLK